jgi:hypothetical protein
MDTLDFGKSYRLTLTVSRGDVSIFSALETKAPQRFYLSGVLLFHRREIR